MSRGTARHQWGAPSYPSHVKTERQCSRCNLVKVTRHEGLIHWVEFWRGLDRIAADATPACEPASAPAEEELA